MFVRTSVRLSICLSVCCPVDRQQQRRAAGLLLSSGVGRRDRSIASSAAYRLSIDIRRRPAAARHAGRVNFGPTVRRSNTYFLFLFSIPCYSVNWPASFRPHVKTGCRIVSQFVSYHNRLFCAMRRQPLLLNTYSLCP